MKYRHLTAAIKYVPMADQAAERNDFKRINSLSNALVQYAVL